MIGPFETYSLRNQNHLKPKAIGIGVLWTVSMASQSVVFAGATVLALAFFNQRWSQSAKAFGWVLASCFLFSLPGLAVVGIDVWKLAGQGWVIDQNVFDLKKLTTLSGVFLGTTSCLFTLLLNIPIVKIFSALTRLGLPLLLVELLYLILRQIQNLANFSQNLLLGQKSRLGDTGLKSRWLGLMHGVSRLLVEAMAMADTSYQALEARSWGGEFRSLGTGVDCDESPYGARRLLVYPSEVYLWLSAVGGLVVLGVVCRAYSIF